ncbi:Pr6Pr family membrane protein [Chryseotalea sanaruensis]|uniref:Pr6Pr family membrane protein n=1 Tax=Chryseotalea sanaruensis TaxID=2482724 RepID=UPI000F8ED404|nr:Pr6Pr family membrane protein [Chryseotalea sanaruensis]
MKKKISLLFAAIAWFAVIAQYYLMIQNSEHTLSEITIRFFSYFTILTNSLVAIYFTVIFFSKENRNSLVHKPGSLTALTVYITIVCLVYQLVLRQIWEPMGLQRLVDELLHSVNPLLVICFWYFYEAKNELRWSALPVWLLYPLIYLFFILFRGNLSEFYPYPFVDINSLGLLKVVLNSLVLLALFASTAALFIFIGKRSHR